MGKKKDEPTAEELKKKIQEAKENYDIKKYVQAIQASDEDAAGEGADKLREHLKKHDK